MSRYETSTTVEEHGQIHVAGVPFAAGTRVDLNISPKEIPATSRQAAYDELKEVYQARQTPNWDAHGAEAVRAETVRNARRFLDALPPECPSPSVGAEPDGHITLEWYRSPNQVLSVSVSSDAMLYWAALVGDEDPRGSCRYSGKFPETILYWIGRVGAL